MNVRAMLVSGVLATGLGGLFTSGAFARDYRPAPDQHRAEVRVDQDHGDRDHRDGHDQVVVRNDRYVQVDRFDQHRFDRDDHVIRVDRDCR